MNSELVNAIDALLPQTQCTKCGYQGCRPYAEALAHGDADINQCPPGGAAGVRKLARLLGRDEKPLNPSNGTETPRAAAAIDESRCIGCMLCIEACPVDAIVGAAKRMHTVLTESCTGCELCLPPCPVDCIDMVELDTLAQRGNRHAAVLAAQSVEGMAALATASNAMCQPGNAGASPFMTRYLDPSNSMGAAFDQLSPDGKTTCKEVARAWINAGCLLPPAASGAIAKLRMNSPPAAWEAHPTLRLVGLGTVH